MDIRTVDISTLTVDDRLDLIERLWISIEEEWGPPPNSGLEPHELMAELERRLEAHERDPSSAAPWEDVLIKLDTEIDRHRK